MRIRGASLVSVKTDTTLSPVANLACSYFDISRVLNCLLPAGSDWSAAIRAADWRDEMPDESDRMMIGRLIWQTGVALLAALLLLAALALGKMVYFMMQEALVVTLVIAIMVTVVLFLLVAFVLFQAGVRRAVLWATTGVGRLVKLSHRQITPPDTIVPPPLGH